MLKIGVLGAGHLGRFHIQQAQASDRLQLLGIFDPDISKAQQAAEEFGTVVFESKEALIAAVDIVDIVTPTLSHFECAKAALKQFKHVFIEKPITETLEQALELQSLVREAGVSVQVGHIERFNPAFQAVKDKIQDPMFIEAHRLSTFNPRGTDVSVVLDLMIHDIDIVLSVVNSPLRKVSASGVGVLTKNPDISNARLEFENGCVANLTASRISLKQMRKTRFFQKNAYISVDFLKKKSECITMTDATGKEDDFALIIDPGNGEVHKVIEVDQPEVHDGNAILNELNSFADSIQNGTEPEVTIDHGTEALRIAHLILEKMKATMSLKPVTK